MATEPITHFSDRAAAVSSALRMTGVVPTAAKAMREVDDKITGALDMFDARTAARDLSEFTEAGRKWAKNPTKGGLERLIEALDAPVGSAATTVPVRVKEPWGETWQNVTASTPHSRRIAAARKGALNGLIAKYDKPAYSTATLIESCKAEVRAWFDNLATEFNEALEALDDVARDKAAGTGRVDSILELIDPATTPEAAISAYRRAARAWAHLDTVAEGYAPLARAMAFNDVSETPNSERDVFDRMEELASHRARFHALMFDAEVCALAVFDMNPVEAVAAGLGHVAPLADPLGDDLPELERRLAVVTAAVGWLDNRRRTHGDRYRGAKGHYTEHDRYGELTPAASLAAFKADRPEVFHAEADEYDLDPVADVYAE
ncbi:hypothetical protein [Corynebacterium accolens]|uniref:hypothetical protein n=2 Tax=Corynebacterium accolens TaxID=38284 RepID=UPI002543D3A1|nr:hypothetical protein [Corynebacterium accolens]MDK4294937.1 hypothetical protein [Corynebacterium accolens]WKS62068.1 hypothetical protein NLL39_09160 [Corynebacterium accolens]